MLLLLPRLFPAVVLATGPSAAPPHTWIADLKANRAAFAGAEIRLEGDVVELRSTSPGVQRGMYRLVDASDPRGVLVRTDRLPTGGGAYRVLARSAPAQPSDSSFVVDEIGRSRIDRTSGLPLIVAGLSAIALVVLATLLVRAVREERRHLVAPPLWLLPASGPYGSAAPGQGAAGPGLRYEPELEEADLRERERLGQRKLRLAQALAGAVIVTGAASAWAARTFPRGGEIPSFVFVSPADTGSPPPAAAGAPSESLPPDRPAVVRLDSVPQAPRPRPRDSATTAKKAPIVVPAPPSRTDTPRVNAAPGSTAVSLNNRPLKPPPNSAPTPAPGPAPAPAPAPVPPSAESRPPTPNLAAERVLATAALTNLPTRLVAAINARNVADVEAALPEGLAQDAGRRERFLKLIKEFGPRATLDRLDDPAFAENRAEARFTVTLSWRGDFGVTQRKSGRFMAVAHRQDTGWQADGATLIDAVP